MRRQFNEYQIVPNRQPVTQEQVVPENYSSSTTVNETIRQSNRSDAFDEGDDYYIYFSEVLIDRNVIVLEGDEPNEDLELPRAVQLPRVVQPPITEFVILFLLTISIFIVIPVGWFNCAKNIYFYFM